MPKIDTKKVLFAGICVLFIAFFATQTKKQQNQPETDFSVKKLSVATPLQKETLEERKMPSGVKESNLPAQDFFQVEHEATVQITCTTHFPTGIRSVVGSGVMIDPKGIILSNAHVAQQLLLTNTAPYNSSCTAGIGNPIQERVAVDLAFLPSEWVRTNSTVIASNAPTGTGEHDYALLQVRTPNRSFRFVNIDTREDMRVDDVLFATSYPKQTGAPQLVAGEAHIESLFTFGTDTIDLLGLTGSAAAQHGASGGAITNPDGRLSGLIVTATQETNLSARTLRAITLAHINRSLLAHTGLTLQGILDQNLTQVTNTFQRDTAPQLTTLLLNALTQ